jgi:hypothetical protein
MTKVKSRKQLSHGIRGSAVAFGFGTIVGLVTSAVGNGTIFESLVLGFLTSIATLLFEAKISEHNSREAGLFVERLAALPNLREDLEIIVNASSNSPPVHDIVRGQLEDDIQLLVRKAQESSANKVVRHFNDNRLRLSLTRDSSRHIRAVSYDAIDSKLWSEDTTSDYWQVQLDFIRRGGKISRIFVFKGSVDEHLRTLELHASAGIEVSVVSLERLTNVGLLDIAHNWVIWDNTCCSYTYILDNMRPSETTYSFDQDEVVRATGRWEDIRVQARPFVSSGPGSRGSGKNDLATGNGQLAKTAQEANTSEDV